MTRRQHRKGRLIAFEGLDQSGKETQARRLGAWFDERGFRVEHVGFPDYTTYIGREIGLALRGERDFGPDVMQLLYVANRHEWKSAIETWVDDGRVVICDRYTASSVAYGEAMGLDPAWLTRIQAGLPKASTTVLLDIDPETAAARKARDRDLFERDLEMLGRVRSSYLRQAGQQKWVVVDARRLVDVVTFDIIGKLQERLRLP